MTLKNNFTKKEKLMLFRILRQIYAHQQNKIALDFGFEQDLSEVIKKLK